LWQPEKAIPGPEVTLVAVTLVDSLSTHTLRAQDMPELSGLPMSDAHKLADWLKNVVDDFKGQVESAHNARCLGGYSVL
jgi:hypothetical protein